jgi:hypothetical protein
LGLSLFEGYSFAAIQLSNALTDCGYGRGVLQTIEQLLIIAAILRLQEL